MYFYYKMYTICKLFYNTFISFQELCMSLRFLPLCPANPVISANICYQTLHHIWWEQCQSPLTACLRRVIQIIAGHIPECSYPNRLIIIYKFSFSFHPCFCHPIRHMIFKCLNPPITQICPC